MRKDQKRGLAWYRDFTLSVIAGMCLLYALIFASAIHEGRGSAIDGKIVLGLLALMFACILLSPNKTFVLIGAFSTVAGLSLPKFITTGDLYALGVILTMLALVVAAGGLGELISYYRNRSSTDR